MDLPEIAMYVHPCNASVVLSHSLSTLSQLWNTISMHTIVHDGIEDLRQLPDQPVLERLVWIFLHLAEVGQQEWASVQKESQV